MSQNSRQYCKINAPHNRFVLSLPKPSVDSATAWITAALPRRRSSGKQEATMELKTRLNMVAALVSFGFLAAIVFGMI
jgi:hypothetical protein